MTSLGVGKLEKSVVKMKKKGILRKTFFLFCLALKSSYDALMSIIQCRYKFS